MALAVLGLSYSAGMVGYGQAATDVLGVDGVRFLPTGYALLLLCGDMVVGCLGGMLAARTTREPAPQRH